ncbi:hypothetical protein PanWU01x14_357780 [Parasponia andersonii]|uniref:Uncharacterized protein n=1 Tax=Parasponia andersonii TaxID=3476 RepID=A0A2P5A8I5_PARAD|nr:hypothetical protein PanWU01x14_357780 [Parasponia andersonii]
MAEGRELLREREIRAVDHERLRDFAFARPTQMLRETTAFLDVARVTRRLGLLEVEGEIAGKLL